MSMIPTDIENLRGAMWAKSSESLIRYSKELGKLQKRIKALEAERDFYRDELWHVKDQSLDNWAVGRARDALTQGLKIREGK